MVDVKKFILGHQKWIIILSCAFIFFLLLLKDPFSERTLIPNFEPYPDTFYYIIPPLNWVKGEGFSFSRERRVLKNNVPPLYALVIAPVFLINPDPRMVYYANVFLALISFILFSLILKKITKNIWIIGITLFLYVTNYFLFWMPTLAMAENLLLPLYLVAILLFMRNISFSSLCFLGVTSLCIFATKFSSVPVVSVILLVASIKILLVENTKKWKFKAFLCLSIAFTFCFFIFAAYLYFISNFNIISAFPGYFDLLIGKTSSYDIRSQRPIGWVSFGYIQINLPLYLNAILGSKTKFLWETTPIIPTYIAVISIIGIFTGLITKKYRDLSIILITMVGISILFMSTFDSFDARYIYIAIPSLFLGFSIMSLVLLDYFSERKKKFIFYSLLLLFFAFYILNNMIRLKSQIRLNFKYSETPWAYVSVLKLNEYFSEEIVIDNEQSSSAHKRPVVISALPPYLVDFYSNGNYTLLPLSSEQEFRGSKDITWGPNDYSNLPLLYTKYLHEGYNVYVSKYGLGSESYTNRDFNTILKEFNTELVLSGCYRQCDIYKITLKKI